MFAASAHRGADRKGYGLYMEQPLVSIVVPVYNGEKTIERCLASLHNQTYRNMEILVVDDGSTDHTYRILDKYKRLDRRFHIINKKNTGVSDSRNVGIELAAGRYLQFVDGDDWLTANAVECLVRAAEENRCDMVISDFYRIVGHNIYKKGHKIGRAHV